MEKKTENNEGREPSSVTIFIQKSIQKTDIKDKTICNSFVKEPT